MKECRSTQQGIDDCSEPQHSGEHGYHHFRQVPEEMQPGTVGVGMSVPAAAGLHERGVCSRVIDDARNSHLSLLGG
jgi:hypothetical protein